MQLQTTVSLCTQYYRQWYMIGSLLQKTQRFIFAQLKVLTAYLSIYRPVINCKALLTGPYKLRSFSIMLTVMCIGSSDLHNTAKYVSWLQIILAFLSYYHRQVQHQHLNIIHHKQIPIKCCSELSLCVTNLVYSWYVTLLIMQSSDT